MDKRHQRLNRWTTRETGTGKLYRGTEVCRLVEGQQLELIQPLKHNLISRPSDTALTVATAVYTSKALTTLLSSTDLQTSVIGVD